MDEMTETEHRGRTMIIVWWWAYAGMAEDVAVWPVQGATADQVRCIDKRYDGNPALQMLAGQALEHLRGADVFVFLHRSHGYDGSAVQQLSQLLAPHTPAGGQAKVFLFGEGADDIYLTHQPKGLLGSKGTFEAAGAAPTLTAVADAGARLLKRAHFDAVWQAYADTLRLRLYEWQQDLFFQLATLTLGGPVAPGDPYRFLCLPENRLLLLRVLSFVGKIRPRSDMAEELQHLAARDQRAYAFDEALTGIRANAKAAPLYRELSQAMKAALLSAATAPDIPALRRAYEDLLAEIS